MGAFDRSVEIISLTFTNILIDGRAIKQLKKKSRILSESDGFVYMDLYMQGKKSYRKSFSKSQLEKYGYDLTNNINKLDVNEPNLLVQLQTDYDPSIDTIIINGFRFPTADDIAIQYLVSTQGYSLQTNTMIHNTEYHTYSSSYATYEPIDGTNPVVYSNTILSLTVYITIVPQSYITNQLLSSSYWFSATQVTNVKHKTINVNWTTLTGFTPDNINAGSFEPIRIFDSLGIEVQKHNFNISDTTGDVVFNVFGANGSYTYTIRSYLTSNGNVMSSDPISFDIDDTSMFDLSLPYSEVDYNGYYGIDIIKLDALGNQTTQIDKIFFVKPPTVAFVVPQQFITDISNFSMVGRCSNPSGNIIQYIYDIDLVTSLYSRVELEVTPIIPLKEFDIILDQTINLRRMLKRIGLNYNSLTDTLENTNLDNIYIMNGIPVNYNTRTLQDDQDAEDSLALENGRSPRTITQEFHHKKKQAILKCVYKTFEYYQSSMAGSVLKIESINYNVSWDYNKTLVSGTALDYNLDPIQIGEYGGSSPILELVYWKETTVDTEIVTTYYTKAQYDAMTALEQATIQTRSDKSNMSIMYQIDATSYFRIDITNFKGFIKVSKQFNVYLTSYINKFRLPIPMSVLNGLPFKEWEIVHENSLCFVIYTYQSVNIEWWQTEGFITILQIVSIVISAYTGGVSGVMTSVLISSIAPKIVGILIDAVGLEDDEALLLVTIINIVTSAYNGNYANILLTLFNAYVELERIKLTNEMEIEDELIDRLKKKLEDYMTEKYAYTDVNYTDVFREMAVVDYGYYKNPTKRLKQNSFYKADINVKPNLEPPKPK